MLGHFARRWRTPRGRRHMVTVAVLTLAVLAAGAGGVVLTRSHARLTTLTQAPAITPSNAPAPAELQAKLEGLVAGYGEDVGIAVVDVERGWTAQVAGDQPFPQQSVSKLWVAITLLQAVDEGRLSLDQWVLLTAEDRSVFFQPVAGLIGPAGYQIQVSNLLRRAIVESDNAANDKLMALAGGPGAVTAIITDKKLGRIAIGAAERDLQSQIAGLRWEPAFGLCCNFEAARARLPRVQRDAAMEAYMADPIDGASPVAIADALAALKRGELLSEPSTQVLLDLLRQVRTGPLRLKGGLPPGWKIGHKTGTGQDWRGSTVGINDVGLLTAPDGRTYAVAVMMRRAVKGVPQRLAFMQTVTRAVAEQWEREQMGRDVRLSVR